MHLAMHDRHFSKPLARFFRRSEMRHTRDYSTGRRVPYFVLHRIGFFVPLPLRANAVGPLPHLFIITLACRSGSGLFIFCDTVRHRGLTHGAPA